MESNHISQHTDLKKEKKNYGKSDDKHTRNSKRRNMKMLKKGLQNHAMWGRKVRKYRLFFLNNVFELNTNRLKQADIGRG